MSREIPGNAWTFSVTYDGDTHWLECDYCEQPVCPISAGDVLEDLLVKAEKHICGPAAQAVTRAP